MKKSDLRIVFMGTPEFAVETLRALVENDYRVVAVVTQPDKPVGRHGSVLQPSQVKQYALEHGLPVLQPEKMKDPEFVEQLRSYGANLQVVVAFRMLPEVVWAMPEYGTFNVHAALLPQYRGAAPIHWAVINGEKETGVTTFFLDHDIDTGRIIRKKTFPIPDDADVEYVYDGLMRLGAQLCLETLETIVEADGHPETVAQEDEQLTQGGQSLCNSLRDSQQGQSPCTLKAAPKIFKETCEIDWTQPAKRKKKEAPAPAERPESMISEDPEKDKLLQKLWSLMQKDAVNDPLILQGVVAERDYYDLTVPVRDYDAEFISDVLIEAWEQVNKLCQTKILDLPF